MGDPFEFGFQATLGAALAALMCFALYKTGKFLWTHLPWRKIFRFSLWAAACVIGAVIGRLAYNEAHDIINRRPTAAAPAAVSQTDLLRSAPPMPNIAPPPQH
jgi:cytosine/uracil/thiamine/allantoin permease